VLALLYYSSIGIGLLAGDSTIVLEPLEDFVHPSTITSVSARAVDTMLFRKVGKISVTVLAPDGGFKSAHGREGVAGSATSLVLDSLDGTPSSPVNGLGSIVSTSGDVEGGVSLKGLSVRGHLDTHLGGGELLKRQIRELIVSHLERLKTSMETSIVLLNGLGGFKILLLEFLEKVLIQEI